MITWFSAFQATPLIYLGFPRICEHVTPSVSLEDNGRAGEDRPSANVSKGEGVCFRGGLQQVKGEGGQKSGRASATVADPSADGRRH